MAQTTLEEMKSIELAVSDVKEHYQKQIIESQEKISKRLKEAEENFDNETKQLVQRAQDYYSEKEVAARKNLAENVARNQQQLESALINKKDALIEQIVARVVEEYGN